jgi:hypothetical protein
MKENSTVGTKKYVISRMPKKLTTEATVTGRPGASQQQRPILFIS